MAVQDKYDKAAFDIAKAYAEYGTCPRMKVGVVFMKDGRPVSVGYNGAPSKQPQCNEVGCDLYIYGENPRFDGDKQEWVGENLITRCRRAIHGEMNAIGYAARNGLLLADTTLYTWPVGPCKNCELLVATIGIKELVFPNKSYNYDVSAPTLKNMGVIVRAVDYESL